MGHMALCISLKHLLWLLYCRHLMSPVGTIWLLVRASQKSKYMLYGAETLTRPIRVS